MSMTAMKSEAAVAAPAASAPAEIVTMQPKRPPVAEKYIKMAKLGPRPVMMSLADNGLAPTALIWDMKSVYMSGTAQRLADTYGITRTAADAYALRSQELANKAVQSGRFDVEIDPIQVPSKGFFKRDEHPRATSAEKLAALSPVCVCPAHSKDRCPVGVGAGRSPNDRPHRTLPPGCSSSSRTSSFREVARRTTAPD